MKKKILIIVVSVIILIQSIYFFIPLVTQNKGINQYGFSAFNAVKYNEEAIGNKLKLTVVWANKVESLEINDLIIIKDNKTGKEEYWIEKVILIDNENITLQTNDIEPTTHVVSKNKIIGKYIKDANLLERVYFVNSNLLGYILSFIIEVGILVIIIYTEPFKKQVA